MFFNTVTFFVKDLPKAINFYNKVFNLESTASSHSDMVYLNNENPRLALCHVRVLHSLINNMHPISSHPVAQTLFSKNVSQKEDVDKFHGMCLNWEGSCGKPPSHDPWGTYSTFLFDPDGNMLEIVWNPKKTVTS